MIDLYTWTTPNGRKISIALEEMGLAYKAHAINISKNEQFAPAFLKISPNNKIPAIVDHDAGGLSIFESGAILIHLAEKSGMFLPKTGAARAKALEWLMWQMAGVGPMFGQAYHFVSVAPEKIPYAIDRFTKEAARLIKVLDTQLAAHPYVAGAEYSIADMSLYPWVQPFHGLMVQQRPEIAEQSQNVVEWIARVGARPAVIKGLAVPQV